MGLGMIGGKHLVPKQHIQNNNFLKFEKTPLDWGFFLVWCKNLINEHTSFHNFIIQKWLKLK